MRIAVHVQPKARTNDLTLQPGGTLRARVTAAPEDGKATRAVLDLIADRLALPKRDVALVSGEHSRTKLIDVPLTGTELRTRLARRM